MSEKILQSRYKQLLSYLSDLDAAVSQLHTQALITQVEKEEAWRKSNRMEKEAFLCSCLTGRGASRLVDISQVLKNEQIRQNADAAAPSNGLPAVEVRKKADLTLGVGGELTRKAQHRRHSQEDVMVPAGGISWDSQPSSSGAIKKDPFSSDKPHLVEDTFSVLFFTFLSQLLHYFNRTSQTSSSPKTRPDETTPTPTPTTTPNNNRRPGWLQVDLMQDSTRDYFSAHALKDVIPSERNPAAIKLSLLLESFQQFYHTHKSFKSKNLSLHEKLLEAIKAKERLEAELNRLGRNRFHDVPPVSKADPRLANELAREVEAKTAEAEALKRSYTRSEQRCKQLVVVTQQWALECEDKVKLINVQDMELKGVKEEIEQLERRVTKYKKFWVEYKKEGGGGGGGGGEGEEKESDLQFEELRNELAFRRELYDMVLLERDQAQKEASSLFAELEALKDHNVQLADRAANYIVQAKAKEPTVREMTTLLEQNRRLKVELEQVAMEKAQLQDKVKALELQIEKLRDSSPDGKPRPSCQEPHPPHVTDPNLCAVLQPRKGQVLITGRSSTPAKCHGAPVFSDVSNLQCPPQKKHRYHYNNNQQLVLSQDNPRLVHHANYPHLAEDDTSSLASSDGGGDSGSFYSSHSSTTTSRSGLTSTTSQGGASTFSHSRPGSAPPSGPHPSSQLGSRDASDALCGNQGSSESGELISEASFEEAGDYTRAIRYPNHSKIHVAPLLDEDRMVLKPEVCQVNGISVKPPSRSPSKELLSNQGYGQERSRERSPAGRRGQDCMKGMEPPNIAPLLFGRTCPNCKLMFRSISDAEFEGHKLSCCENAITI